MRQSTGCGRKGVMDPPAKAEGGGDFPGARRLLCPGRGPGLGFPGGGSPGRADHRCHLMSSAFPSLRLSPDVRQDNEAPRSTRQCPGGAAL